MSQPPYDQPRQDRLVLDITRDLERVDAVMTRVITDPVMTDEFIRDPSGVLIRLGLYPRTTREIQDRVNRVFYAILTNTKLLELLVQHYSVNTFAGPTDADNEVLASALERGEIENRVEYDLAGFEHFASNAEVVRQAFRLSLADLNDRRILVNHYSSEQINEYVDELAQAIVDRRAIRDFPILEEWDDNYGIGKQYGNNTAIVLIPVEAGAIVTIAIEVNVYVDFAFGAQRQALLGDPGAARKLATVGAIFRFAGELMVHINNFERSYVQR